MIVDSHAHIFPYLGQAPGDRHLQFLQRGISGNQQPVRRSRDNAIVPHPIWEPGDFSPRGYRDVHFRVGRFGRFEWTWDGVDYYKQFMPPSLADNACGADYLVAEMDYAGLLDRAVLQNDHFYGALNDLFADAVRRFPDRFLATAHVDELTVAAPAALDALRAAAECGLRGIFYDSRDYWTGADNSAIDEPRFNRFWDEVERLRLVVYWVPGGAPAAGVGGYLGQLQRWRNRLERNPTLPMVLVGGLPTSLLDADPAGLPREVLALARSGRVCIEVCFPIVVGGSEEYPYHGAIERVKRLYQECGAAALTWGSDVPNVLRYCTYAQSLDHLRRHADFMPLAELDLVLGGNLAHIFGLAGEMGGPTDFG